MLSNLALGNEKLRSTLVNRVELLEALSEAVVRLSRIFRALIAEREI